MDRFLRFFGHAVERYPKLVLLSLLIITAALGYQITQLKVANDPHEFLPRHPTVEAFKQIEKDFGAESFYRTIFVRFVPKANFNIISPQAILEMEAVLQALRKIPGVAEASGLPDFVKFLRQELHGGQREYLALPIEGDELGYSFEDIIKLTLDRVAFTKKYLSPQGTAVVLATIAKGADMIQISRQAQAALEALKASAVATDVELLSYGATLDVFNQTTRRDVRVFFPVTATLAVLTLAWVFGYAKTKQLAVILALLLGVFALSLIPFWESSIQMPLLLGLSLTLIAIITYSFRRLSNLYLPLIVVILAGIWTFGLLHLTGLPANFLMAAVIPLLLGVGIDYPLYLLYRYEEEREKHQNGPQAIQIALKRVGRALALATITTIAGFSSLIGINSPPIQAFGLLSNFAMASTFLVTITLIPAVKSLMDEAPRESTRESWLRKGLGRYAGVLGRRRFALGVLLLAAVASLLFYVEGKELKTYTYDIRRLLPKENAIIRLYDQINQEFRLYDEVQILVKSDVAQLDVMRLITKDIPMALGGSPYTGRLTSIAQLIDDLRNSNPYVEQTFMNKFVNESPDTAYRWVLDYIFARSELRQRAEAYVHRDETGRYDAAVIRINTLRHTDRAGIQRVTEDISQRFAGETPANLGMTLQITGSPYIEYISLNVLKNSFFLSMGLALLLCFAVMAVALRSLVWGLISVIPVGLVTALELGTISLLGIELNVATVMVTAIVIGLGVDYAIHVVERFREERDLTVAVSRTGEVITADVLTTVAAFFSLLLSQITWNRDFGLLAGTTILYIFIVTVFVFPALLALIEKSKSRGLETFDLRL